LNVTETAECVTLLPCYTPNKTEDQEKLDYAVAIC